MGNNFFRFKQFTIHQERSAMKVGTDGVLLGAWVGCSNAKFALDIGTGTGLISIMIAQRCHAKIDAVEIDSDSFYQAVENVQNCPWNERIKVYQGSIQEFAKQSERNYDLIISNPPFFNNSLKPNLSQKAISKHTDTLSHSELIQVVTRLLTVDGKFSVILPYTEGMEFIEQCLSSGLFCTKKTTVLPCPWKNPTRLLMEFRKSEMPTVEDSITIELSKRHEYSPDYISLTKDFYL